MRRGPSAGSQAQSPQCPAVRSSECHSSGTGSAAAAAPGSESAVVMLAAAGPRVGAGAAGRPARRGARRGRLAGRDSETPPGAGTPSEPESSDSEEYAQESLTGRIQDQKTVAGSKMTRAATHSVALAPLTEAGSPAGKPPARGRKFPALGTQMPTGPRRLQ